MAGWDDFPEVGAAAKAVVAAPTDGWDQYPEVGSQKVMERPSPAGTRKPDALDYLKDTAVSVTRNIGGMLAAPWDIGASIANSTGGASPEVLQAMTGGALGVNPMDVRMAPGMEGKMRLPTSGDMLTQIGVPQPVTDEGRIAGTGLSALLGPGTLLQRGAGAAGATAGGLLANLAAPGNAPAEFAGLLGGSALTAVPWMMFGPNAAERLVASKLGEGGRDPMGVLNEAVNRMRAAQGQGTSVTAGQAVPELGSLESSLYATRPNTLKPTYDAQNVSGAETLRQAATDLTGMPGKNRLGSDDLTKMVNEAANDLIFKAADARRKAAQAAGYTAADAESLAPELMKPIILKITDALEKAPVEVRGSLQRLLDNLTGTQGNIERVSQAYRLAKDTVDAGAPAMQSAEAAAAEKATKAYLRPIVDDLDAALKTNKNYAAGAAEFERLSPGVQALTDLTNGKLGKLADAAPGTLGQIIMGMSSDKRQAVAQLLSFSPQHRDAVPAIMRDLLNDAMTSAGNRAQSYGATAVEGLKGRMPTRLGMPDAATGDAYLALRDFATALPGGQQRWATFEKVLDTLALQKQPSLGSNTVDKATMAATLAGVPEKPFMSSPAVGMGAVVGGGLGTAAGTAIAPGVGSAIGGASGAMIGSGIARSLERLRQAGNIAGNSENLTGLLTDPAKLEALKPLLMMDPASDRAKALVRTVLFGEGANDRPAQSR